MAANLPPQFFELQKRLNLTQDVEEKIEILKEMLAICPKHKGTERVQEEIKKKIAKLKKEEPKKIKREALFFVKKEGAGQVLVLGPPNSGKTSLVNALCNTSFKVANYPFSTRLPQPAMVDYENIKIQIVDTPPISKDFRPGWMKNLARGADLILVLIDLTENPKESLKEILEILNEWGIEKDKILILGNKTDLKKNGEDLKIFEVSAKEKIGVEELKKKIFEALKIVRVFTKGEKEKVNFNAPFVLKEGTRLIDFVKEINKEWVERFKGAKLYSKDLKRFQMVGRDYILKDGDIVEIKT
jgi:small GTP-binding protein